MFQQNLLLRRAIDSKFKKRFVINGNAMKSKYFMNIFNILIFNSESFYFLLHKK